MTRKQAKLLALIERHEPVTTRELAERINIGSPSCGAVSARLHRLFHRGWVVVDRQRPTIGRYWRLSVGGQKALDNNRSAGGEEGEG